MVLFLLGSFALIIGFVSTPSIQYYTGGAVIGLFMAGLFYAYGNSILQTRRMEEKLKKEQEDVAAAATAPAPSSS
jgi:short-subunit dehydrogenase involved in D-alanine esterification of teichoic acids